MRSLERILAIPLLIAISLWIINSLSNPNSPKVAEKGAELIAQAAIPWWIPVLQFLVGFSRIIALIFLFFLFINKGSH